MDEAIYNWGPMAVFLLCAGLLTATAFASYRLSARNRQKTPRAAHILGALAAGFLAAILSLAFAISTAEDLRYPQLRTTGTILETIACWAVAGTVWLIAGKSAARAFQRGPKP